MTDRATSISRSPADINAAKTHCKNGHPLSGDNLRLRGKTGRQARVCITCRRQKDRDAKRRLIIAAHPDGPDPALIWEKGMAVKVWQRISVDRSSGCWLWQGTLTASGYGFTEYGAVRRRTRAHRYVYELLSGSVPEGLELDHLCRVRHCVNPDHLEPVTHWENLLRSDNPFAVNARKTHCLRAHELAGDNLRIEPDGYRTCRECERLRKRASHGAKGSQA